MYIFQNLQQSHQPPIVHANDALHCNQKLRIHGVRPFCVVRRLQTSDAPSTLLNSSCSIILKPDQHRWQHWALPWNTLSWPLKILCCSALRTRHQNMPFHSRPYYSVFKKENSEKNPRFYINFQAGAWIQKCHSSYVKYQSIRQLIYR